MNRDRQSGHILHVDGADLYYEVSGPTTRPALLMLHGGLGSIEDLRAFEPALAERFRMIRIDSRGHGRSTLGTEDVTYQRLEADALRVLRHLDIRQTAVLGFSDGGIVAYRLMASQQIEIATLVTIGAPCELEDDDPVRDIYARVTGPSWRERFPDSHESYQRLNPAPDFDRLVSSCVQMWLDSEESGYPGGRVEEIEGDVLLLRGDGDHLFTRRQAVDLADRIRGSVFANIPFAGHAAHEERPDLCVRIVEEFLGTRAGAGDA